MISISLLLESFSAELLNIHSSMTLANEGIVGLTKINAKLQTQTDILEFKL